MPRLNNIKDMEQIYTYCKKVYLKELCVNDACDQLGIKVPFSKSSLKMYFNIYSCMMNGKCYKMGTSESFTKFLIEKIHNEYGKEFTLRALSSAKQNADYRISWGNEQPGIEKVCKEILQEYQFNINYEDLSKQPIVTKDSTHDNDNSNEIPLELSITYGETHISLKGTPEQVKSQLRNLSTMIGESLSAVDSITSNSSCNNQNTVLTESIGSQLKSKYLVIEKLKSKKDFKAKMIPLLVFASESGLKTSFTISDVLVIMKDALEEEIEKKDIEFVFSKKKDWFEQIGKNPRKYTLQPIAFDYSKNILADI